MSPLSVTAVLLSLTACSAFVSQPSLAGLNARFSDLSGRRSSCFSASESSWSASPAARSRGSPRIFASVDVASDMYDGAERMAEEATSALRVPAKNNGDGFSLKDDLLAEIDLATSASKRTYVNELLLKLEPMNPTDRPASSDAMNGVWEFLYTGGMSPGMLGVQALSKVAKRLGGLLDLKMVTLTVNQEEQRVEGAVTVSLFGGERTIRVRTRLHAESDIRLVEEIEELVFAGRTIPVPKRLRGKRTLFITYLDDDIMVARENSGAPDLLLRRGVPNS